MHIEHLLKMLDLGELVSAPAEVRGGLLHRMFRVQTSRGIYAVKVLNSEIVKRPNALNNTENAERIAAALSGRVPAVVAFLHHGKRIHEVEGAYYMVFDWLDARSIFAPELTEMHCSKIGDLLGKIHSADLQVEGIAPEEDSVPAFDWNSYLERAACVSGCEAWRFQYEQAVQDLINWNQAARNAQTETSRIMVVSHRDLDPKNVMWRGDDPFLIDWEAAGYVNPYQELLEVVNYWTDRGDGTLNPGCFRALTHAYQEYMDLKHVQWDWVIAGSVSGMLGWLEYNVRRALGMEVSSEEEVQQGVIQTVQTLDELYRYQKKCELLRAWVT